MPFKISINPSTKRPLMRIKMSLLGKNSTIFNSNNKNFPHNNLFLVAKVNYFCQQDSIFRKRLAIILFID